MADFLSQYTGQQIDTILGSVSGKVSSNDIVDDFAVSDPIFPASSRLTAELKSSVDTINDTLTNKVIRTDGGEQTINGKKTFAAVIVGNGGLQIPAGKTITIADEPSNPQEGVNLSMLRKHGVSEDTASATSGLSITLLPNGYNALSLDLTRLDTYSGSTIPGYFPVSSTGGTYRWSIVSLFNAIFDDTRMQGFVRTVDYVQDMLDVQNQITTINTTLGNKVNTSTYNTKMGQLDTSISNINTSLTTKVDTSTYNTKMTSLDASITSLTNNKVEVSTYTAKMTSLDTSIANSVMKPKTNLSSYTVSASGSTALPDFDMAKLCQILVTAQWGTGNIVDTYRVTITQDGTVKTELLIQKSTAGTVTFTGSVVSGKLRITVVNANTTTACSVDYSLRASF